MKAIGFSFAKQQVRATVLDGTKAAPIFVDKDKAEYGAGLSPSEIAIWLNRNFKETLTRFKPELAFYRMTWSYSKQQQAYSLVFPCAIMELVCAELKISCQGFGTQAITFKALGFPKGVDLADHCTKIIGAHPPHWDQQQINSALAAICGMH